MSVTINLIDIADGYTFFFDQLTKIMQSGESNGLAGYLTFYDLTDASLRDGLFARVLRIALKKQHGMRLVGGEFYTDLDLICCDLMRTWIVVWLESKLQNVPDRKTITAVSVAVYGTVLSLGVYR